MAEHNETGKKGEQAAAEYLGKKGYLILEVNWRSGSLEADIIAMDGEMLVIIEVKTRRSADFGPPEAWVTKAKQKNLIRAANKYVEDKELDAEVRFDIISVISNNTGSIVNHIEDAFFPLVGK